MTARKRQLGAEEVKRRKRLANFTANPTFDPARLEDVGEDLRAYDIAALLVRPLPGDRPLRALLRAEDYELAREGDLLDLWVRAPSSGGGAEAP
jgi:hypothetical protein